MLEDVKTDSLGQFCNLEAEEHTGAVSVKREDKRLLLRRYGVFNERPLKQALIDCCVVDVAYLPDLLDAYNTWLMTRYH